MTTDSPAAFDLGRRIAAARAYRDMDQRDLARRLGVDPATLGRYEKGWIQTGVKQDGLIARSAKELRLPREFFSIDFSRLPEMHAAWRQIRDEVSTPEDLAAALERDEAETLPPDPSGSQTGEQGP